MLSVDQLAELLSMIAEEKKISFDKAYADELYYEYNAKRFDDSNSINLLKDIISNKKVLLVAPGTSVLDHLDEIEKYSKNDNVVTIALNNVPPFNVDYVFVSKKAVMDYLNEMDVNIIATSNVTTESDKTVIINYTSWTYWSEGKSDNALIVMMNILKAIGVKDVLLAGFDGFTPDVDSNYYDEKLKRPVTKEQADYRNNRTTQYLMNDCKSVNISFITDSLYEII